MKSKETLFSILIANYNNERYLLECIESVLIQSYENWEIIIVDDKSTDESNKLYSLLIKNPKIRIFYNKKNYGIGYTKMKLIQLAKGKYASFLDPDDKIAPHAIKTMVSKLESDKNISLCFSNHYLCNEMLEPLEIREYEITPPYDSFFVTKGASISHLYSFNIEKYKQSSGMIPYRRSEDQDFFIKMDEVGSIEFVDDELYYYRIHANSLSQMDNWWKANHWYNIVRFDNYLRRKRENYRYNIKYNEILSLQIAYYRNVISFFIRKGEYVKSIRIMLAGIYLILKQISEILLYNIKTRNIIKAQ